MIINCIVLLLEADKYLREERVVNYYNLFYPRYYMNTYQTCYKLTFQKSILFPVWLRNRLISARLEPVLSHTETLCITSHYIQFSTNIKMYNYKIITSFVSTCLSSGLTKLVLISKLYICISAESCLVFITM